MANAVALRVSARMALGAAPPLAVRGKDAPAVLPPRAECRRGITWVHIRGMEGRVGSARLRAFCRETEATTRSSSARSATELYLALEEMERQAQEDEVECVGDASSVPEAAQCNVEFLEKADDIELAKLAAKAVGSGSEKESTLAAAAVKGARIKRRSAVERAEAAELECIINNGHRGGECAAAFVSEWDRAEEEERQAVQRYRNLLRRWVKANKINKSS